MKTETVFYVAILAALLLKKFGVDGAGPILILVFGSLSVLYGLPGIYFYSVDKISNQKWGITIPAMLLFPLAPLCFLFKVMHWVGSASMAVVALLGITVIAILAYYFRSKPGIVAKVYYDRMLIRCGLLLGLTLLAFA